MGTWISARGFGLPPSAESICEGQRFVKRSGRRLVGGKRHRVSHDAVDDQRGSDDTGARESPVVARPDAGEDLDGRAQKGWPSMS
jgi:hypothetical protein